MSEVHLTDNTKQKDKTVTIIVNGRERSWAKNAEISYEEVVRLAFENPPMGDDVQHTVQYTRGEGHRPTGALVEGQSVKVKEGMVFDVTPTNRS